jgi:hypothetical protein
MELAPHEYTHDELLAVAAASLALAFAVSQDLSALQAATPEQVVAQAHTLYLESTESALGQESDGTGRSEEEERDFTQRFLHYYDRAREACADDPERFSLLQGILVGGTLGEDIVLHEFCRRLIIAACVPSVRAEIEDTWAGASFEAIAPTIRAYRSLLETIVAVAPSREPGTLTHPSTPPTDRGV